MRREREAANRRYAGFTAGVLFSVLALTATVWLLRPADLDAATLCPTNRPLAGHTVVIVDRTDRWTQAMGSALTQLVENAQRDTDKYEKFSIVSLDANQSVHPLFSVCNPGEPSFWSDLYRGRRYTTRDFEQRFVGAAERVIEDVREPSEASSSPIVEYVHRWLGSDDFSPGVRHRRMILVSDMRQNSQLYSIYSGAEGELGEVVARQFGPSAEGVAFDVYFVAHGRDHNVSEDEVRTAWDRAFGRIGADYSWRQISSSRLLHCGSKNAPALEVYRGINDPVSAFGWQRISANHAIIAKTPRLSIFRPQINAGRARTRRRRFQGA